MMDQCCPFEWLTSPSSIDCILESTQNLGRERALDVGCGNSTLGEYLLEQHRFQCVVNLDRDEQALLQIKKRWTRQSARKRGGDGSNLQFALVDFAKEPIPYPAGHFDLIVDKSTLDCTLCCDEAAALLTEVYRLLTLDGVYLVISFHHVDYLLPLLQNCPGADWAVRHAILRRQQVEHSMNGSKGGAVALGSSGSATNSSWSTGMFEPDEQYRTTVNVFVCQRRRPNSEADHPELDRAAVQDHIHKANDDWFRSQNPMLTAKRIEDLRQAFCQDLDLRQSYNAIFTDTEREHFSFDLFLEDWRAFTEKRGGVSPMISFDTAVAFLEEMQ